MEEYQVLTAGTASDSINVTVNVTAAISISAPEDVLLSPDIIGTGVSDGSATWTVTSNVVSGWKLELEASTAPALIQMDATFADYTEAVGGTPETWSVDVADSEFGFTASGTASAAKYSSGTLYEGFSGETKIEVASVGSSTPGGGIDTTVGFRAEVGSSHNQPSGTYTSTITATATTL